MQADLAARVALPAGFSFEAVGGLRGQVRDPDLLVPIQNFQPVSTSQLISREHYLMWEPEAVGPYLRVGRFYAPYGLRMAEHILYINRDLGYDELEETYNVSGGFVYPERGAAPDGVRARLRPPHRQRRERLRRLPGVALPRGHDRARRSDARGDRAGRDQADGRRRRKGYLERLHTLLLGEVDVVNNVFTISATARARSSWAPRASRCSPCEA